MADEETPPLANPTHFEDVAVPIVYADFVMGGGPINGDNITLTFATTVLDHRHNPPQRITKSVMRLVMPRVALIGAADFVQQITKPLEPGSSPPPANTTIN